MALPLIPLLLGLTAVDGGAVIADQRWNEGAILTDLAGDLAGGAGSLLEGVLEGGTTTLLEYVMSEEAAEACMDDSYEFFRNRSQYADQINWGRAIGLGAGIVFGAEVAKTF